MQHQMDAEHVAILTLKPQFFALPVDRFQFLALQRAFKFSGFRFCPFGIPERDRFDLFAGKLLVKVTADHL
jgi:hypothetical protein